MAGFLFCGFICYIAVMFWLGSKFILALKLDSNCMVMEKFDPTTTIAFWFESFSVFNIHALTFTYC